MSEKKKDILNHIIIYLPSRYFSQFLGFFISLFMKRFLGPLFAGTWDFLKVIMGYVDYSELGSTQSVYYKIPILNGQQKYEEADRLRDNVFTFVMICSTVASLGMFIYALFFYKGHSPLMFWGLIGSSFIIIFERIHSFYIILLRANKDYSTLSKSTYFDAIVNLLLVLLIVSRFKFYGLLVAINLLTILNIIFIRYYARYNLKFRINWKDIVSYIKFGFPVYLTAIFTTLLNSVDRLMIAGFLGFQQLGFYSIAMMSKNYSHQLSTNFSHVTSPHFMEDFGRYGNSERIYKYITKGTFSLACVMAFIQGLIFIFSYPLVKVVLPAFMPGLTALRIFLLISLLASLVTFPSNYIVTQDKQKMLVIFSAISLAANIIFNYAFIRAGLGINGVALASAIATFIYVVTIMIYAMKHFAGRGQIIAYFIKFSLPCLYVMALILFLERYVVIRQIWINAFVKSAFFILASALLAVAIEKETGLFKVFFDLIRKKFAKNEK